MNLNRVAARAEATSVVADLAADDREVVDTATVEGVVATVAVAEDRDARINGAGRRAVVLTANRPDLRSVHDSTSVIPKIADRQCLSSLSARPLGKSRSRRFWRPRIRTIT